MFLATIVRTGNRLVAAGDHGAIIYSDDNGYTWRQAHVPVSVEITALGFATASEGWAVGHYGIILHTGDGGQTWQEQLNGLEAARLTLDAAKAAVASKGSAAGVPHAILRASHFISDGPDKPFLTVLVLSPREAMVFGAYRMVMKTTDGGRTWSDWSLHIDDALSHNLYDAEKIGNDIYIAAETGLVFDSSDGGNFFRCLSQPGAGTLFGLVDNGANGVVVFGVAGEAYLSEDKGLTWQPILLRTTADLTSGHILRDRTVVIAAQDGTLYISHDQAHSFNPLPDVQPMAISDFVEAADGDLIVVGSSGIIRIKAEDFE
jgi:photosystem II stability/assembly factor-like uncharacterized protein